MRLYLVTLLALTAWSALAVVMAYDLTRVQASAWIDRPEALECDEYEFADYYEGAHVIVVCKSTKGEKVQSWKM